MAALGTANLATLPTTYQVTLYTPLVNVTTTTVPDVPEWGQLWPRGNYVQGGAG